MSLLSGKYLQAEQAAPGVIQTFRARDLATGDPVFVHRIGDANCNEQASLLRLLLMCLYRSPAVKKLVLEVREDANACYVVTESAPQCFLLREWLELEARNAEGSNRALADLESAESKLKEVAPGPPAQEGTGSELSLSVPFVSEAVPATPQAAPIKSIRPLPPDFSPAPQSASSDLFALSGIAAKKPGRTLVIEKSNLDAAKPESLPRVHPPNPRPSGEVAAPSQPFQKDATPSSGYSSHPAVLRPAGALPLDEFSRLFADPEPGNGATTELLSTVRSPISGPVPPPTHARPALNPLAEASQPTPFATPIMPSAAQTVLESALAAQAASQRNRNLIIGIVVVVLIVLAVVLMVLTFSRTQ